MNRCKGSGRRGIPIKSSDSEIAGLGASANTKESAYEDLSLRCDPGVDASMSASAKLRRALFSTDEEGLSSFPCCRGTTFR